MIKMSASWVLALAVFCFQATSDATLLRRADDPTNCQCTMTPYGGGMGDSVKCADYEDCISVSILGYTPNQHGLCDKGEFCEVKRVCFAEKIRWQITYNTACDPGDCCSENFVEVWELEQGVVAGLVPGQSWTLDVGGWDLSCGLDYLSWLEMRCVVQGGGLGTLLRSFYREYTCVDCS